jgi:HemX protein
MPLERFALALSTFAFLAAVVPALAALKTGDWRRNTAQVIAMALGFFLQTAAIYLRGQEVGQCPMKSISDVLVFIAWSVVLLYFLVGTTYRVSLLGMFTAPLVVAMHALAFFLPNAFPDYSIKAKIDGWVELHAALALVSYASFALACITGVMYLLQERLLKRHLIGGLFYQLPPIQGLAKAIQRLILLGLILLTISLLITFKLPTLTANPKLVFSWAVWTLYSVIAFVTWRHTLSPRQTAWLASTAFVLPFLSLWLVTRS